jgi:uncharacterized protein (TIGR03437 family)
MAHRLEFVVSASLLVLAAKVAAQPQIAPGGVVNSASNAAVGSPNSSIAPGSIFSIYGSNLGPSSSPALAYPLQTTLGGVSLQVSQGSTMFNAFPIFVGPNQLNAILPGSVPAGVVTLSVNYNGQTSNTVSIQVAANSFGIFAVSSSGVDSLDYTRGPGVGVITGANGQLYSLNSAAHAGDVATLWGTGIGASPGDDGSAPPRQIDMPDLPLSVFAGNQKVNVLYRGRTGFTGEDQINFVIPPGVAGCYVPVAVQIGNIVSNFVTMPIAPAGQSCPDPARPVRQISTTGNILLRRYTMIGTETSTTDGGSVFFGDPQILAFPYYPPVVGNPYSLPAGACSGGITYPGVFDILTSELNAGPAITITGPNGVQQIVTAVPNSGTYSPAEFGGGANPLYLDAGAYTASGPGGTNVAPVVGWVVGPFAQNFTIPPPLTWTNQAGINTVDRSMDLDVTWDGGDPNGTVQITGYVGFVCNAKNSNHHFTIPAFVLLSLPPSSEALPGYISLGTVSTTPFTAPGISSGTINSVVTIVKTVTYQ